MKIIQLQNLSAKTLNIRIGPIDDRKSYFLQVGAIVDLSKDFDLNIPRQDSFNQILLNVDVEDGKRFKVGLYRKEDLNLKVKTVLYEMDPILGYICLAGIHATSVEDVDLIFKHEDGIILIGTIDSGTSTSPLVNPSA